MKLLILFTSLFFATSFGVYAQNSQGIEVSNTNSHRTKFIPEGTKIQLTQNGTKYKGKLKVVSDQLICIGADTLTLNQVRELRAKTSSSKLGGIALLAPGSFLGGFGLYAIGIGLAEGGWGFLAVIIGTPPAVVGVTGAIIGAKLLLKGKKFDHYKWKYKLIGPESLQVSN